MSESAGRQWFGSARRRLLLGTAVLGTAALVVFVSAAAALPSCTDTYNPADTGGDWSTAANWSTSAVPTSSDVACWGAAVTVVVTTGATADSIQGGVLEINGGTLDLASNSDDSTVGNVTLAASSTLDGPSPLTIDGSFTWTGSGTLDATITQVDGSGTCFTLNGTGQAYLTGGSVQTSCQVTIDNTGTINTGGATVTTTSTIDFGAGVVVGQGGATFTATGIVGPASGTYGFAADALDLASGSTSVASGTTLESGPLTVESGQTVTIASTGEMEQTGGTGQIDSGGKVTGAGSLDVGGGTFDVDSGGTLSSGFSVSGGTLTSDTGSTTGSSSSTVSVTSGTLSIAGAATAGDVTLSGGAISGAAQLSVDGSFDWTAQAQLDAKIVQTDGAGTCFTISGTGQAYLTGGSIQTSCQVTIDNTGFINTGGATVTTTSTIDFGTGVVVGQSGATFTAAGVIGPGSGTYGFDGDPLVLSSGTTSVTNGETLEAASVVVQSGQTATIDSGGTLDQLGGGAGQIESGGEVTGAGNLEVAGGTMDVDSGGTLSSGMSVAGGTLTADSGSTTGTSSSAVAVTSGTLAIDGAATTGDVTLSGGAISGTAQLSVDGSFSWTAQAQLDADIVQTDGSGTCFTISGSTGQLYMTGGSVQTSCQVTIDNPGFITAGNATVTTTSTLDFGAGLDIPVNGGDNATFTAAGVAANAGPTYGTGADTLVLTAGSTTVASGNTLDSGPLTIQGGDLQDDGTLNGTTTLTGGTLDGTGTLDGSLDQTGGTLNPGDAPGTLSLHDGYTQAAGGTLVIPVTSATIGGASSLNVTGSISLAGTLKMEPSDSYAASASQGDEFGVIDFTGSQTGTFSTVSSSPALRDGETFSEKDTAGTVDAIVGAAQPPVNNGAPVISGNTVVGDQLQTTNGTWTNTPSSFTYQWQDCTSAAANSCTNVAGSGTGGMYTLQSSDVGSYVTVIVTAHNAAATAGQATGTPVKGPVTNPAPPPPTAPKNTAPPAITGTPASGKTLTCGPGSWSPAATSYTYTWTADGTPIIGATAGTYTVQQVDEGLTLTCTVIASNTGGRSTPVSSAGIKVPIPVIKGCPAATGKLGGTTLGVIHLGMTRPQARHAFTKSTNRGEAYMDFFCLTPRGVRVGYASPKLLKTLPKSKRAGLTDRVIWASTSNGFYNVHGIRPGATLAAAKQALPGGNYFRVGLNYWYLAPNGGDTAVLKLRAGVVQEIGIGDKALTKGLKAQKTFMTSFE